MTSAPFLWLHVGDPRHGVSRFGRVLAEASRRGQPGEIGAYVPGSVAIGRSLARWAQRDTTVITQFTDRLWGADPSLAADHFEVLAERLHPARLVVGMHDIPRPDELARRSAYSRVARRSALVVVCSQHERRRLLGFAVESTVVPHPIEDRRPPRPRLRFSDEAVAVLGFVYPSKGHADVLDAAARSTSGLPVVALGGAAPGHDDLVRDLTDKAESIGVAFHTTGWLSDAILVDRARAAAVPVVPNCQPSASGSLATWLGTGRRPLVRDSDYAREIADLVPGGIHLYFGADRAELPARIDEAASSPERTILPEVPASLSPDRIARRWIQIAGNRA